jgi:hypothetical protein
MAMYGREKSSVQSNEPRGDCANLKILERQATPTFGQGLHARPPSSSRRL